MFLEKYYRSCQEEVLEVLTSTSDPYPTEILQQNPCSDPDWTLIFRLRIAKLLTYLLTYIHTWSLACLPAYILAYILAYLLSHLLTTKKFRASSTYLVTHLRRRAGV